jgi:glycosyltransferase involved in cell wall biosynthesis
MRVALLTSANGWRGSSVSYAKLARGLGERDHTVQLITAVPRVTERFVAEGLPVTEIPGRNTGPREVWALFRTLRRHDVQAVVVDTPRDVRLSAYATLFQGARIVYRYNLNYRRPRDHLADRVYQGRVSACVFQSQFIQEDALRQAPWMGRLPAYRIPNGYDTDRFAPRPEAGRAFRARWDIPADIPVVLTSAKLARNKGHEVAIAALDRVHRGGLELLYLICGDGAREGELRSLAGACGLPARFTGLLKSQELIAALAAADVVVHPSPQEIFPNAVGEAMSCARAVVAADAGGTGELLGRDGVTGVLVAPDDPEAMAQAVDSLLRDPARRGALGWAARRRIETEFPLRRMIGGYEAALREVVGPGE